MRKQAIIFCTFISLFCITACYSEVRPSPTPQSKAEKTNKQSGADKDRGFDPCLINANLPVCSNK